MRRATPDTLFIAGGFGPTLEPEKFLDKGADAVILGEGEETLLELATRVEQGISWSDVRNLVFRNGGMLYRNPLRPVLRNLDDLPLQLRFCPGIYVVKGGTLEERDPLPKSALDHLFGARGCVGSCTYCSAGNWRKIYTQSGVSIPKYRYPSNDVCLQHFKALKHTGCKSIVIADDFFIRPYHVLKEFLNRYSKEIGLPFWAYFHPQFLCNHPDILDLALQARLTSLCLPVQSACETANTLFGRCTDLSFVVRCAFRANAGFVPFSTHFIDGFIAEGIDEEEYLHRNLQFIRELPPFHPGFPGLVEYSISYLRLHLNAPLLHSGKTRRMSCVRFFYRAMLMLFRYILNDEEFETLTVNKTWQREPEQLLPLYNRLRAERHQAYMVSEARRLAGCDVLVWGGGDVYAGRKSLLMGLRPRAVVADVPVSTKSVDGLPVVPLQEILDSGEKLPVFICVRNPQPLARRLKQLCPDYPNEHIIGFGE